MITDLMKTKSIQEVVDLGASLPISHHKMFMSDSFVDKHLNSIHINTHSVINRYMEIIKKNSTVVKLTDDQLSMYKYQPKKLCMDYYNTLEIWSLILKLNDMTSILDFNKKNLLLPTNSIFDLLNEIMILENIE